MVKYKVEQIKVKSFNPVRSEYIKKAIGQSVYKFSKYI